MGVAVIDGTFNRVGESQVLLLTGQTDQNLRVSLRFHSSGATVVLERQASGIPEGPPQSGIGIDTAWGTTVVTYTTDQSNTVVAAVSGQVYRLRCTVAPSAGVGVSYRVTQGLPADVVSLA